MRNRFLYALLTRLEQAGVDYAVIRGWEDIPNTMSGGDMDLWIEPAQFAQLRQIVKEVLETTDGHVVSFLDNLMVPKYTFLGLDWGLQMDAALYPIQFHCYDSLPNDIAGRYTILYNGYKVVSPDADAYMAFFKEVLNNGYCQKEKYVVNLRKVLIKSSQEEINENLSLYSAETIQKLQAQVLDENRQDFHDLAKALKRDILPAINLRFVRNQLMKWKRIFCHPGYVIAVLGTDGSGKSAIIDAITPWLDEAFHNNVHYKHLRPGWIPDIAVVLGKRKESEVHPVVVSTPHSGTPSGGIGSMMRVLYYLLDYTLGYFQIVWRQIAAHSNVFIFDRYYYDYYIDQRRSLINLPKWIIRVGEIFVPKPDIILCLGGDPEKIYARKPETSLEEVARQTEELKRFTACRKNAVWIDTTQSIENSILDAKTAIFNMMSTRFKDVL